MQLTKNFNLKEFTHSRFFNEHQDEVLASFSMNEFYLKNNIQKLANQLQVLRDFVNKPIHINIAYRPVWWELKKKRSGNSKHCLGMAADIVVDGYTTEEIKDIIEQLILSGDMLQGGLGIYNSFIHYDIFLNAGKKRRWDYRK